MRVAFALLPLICTCFAPGFAQDKAPRTLAVNGSARVVVPIDHVLIRAEVRGKAELSSDARTKFESARRRFLESMSGLEIENLTISGDGAKFEVAPVGQNDRFNRQVVSEDADTEVIISETIVLRVDAIATLSREDRLKVVTRVLDVMTDQKVKLAGTPNPNAIYYSGRVQDTVQGISFEPKETDTSEDEAYKLALKDARDRAERLAKLAGVELGPLQNARIETANTRWKKGDATGVYELSISTVYAIQ